jgi:hypothetical protein
MRRMPVSFERLKAISEPPRRTLPGHRSYVADVQEEARSRVRARGAERACAPPSGEQAALNQFVTGGMKPGEESQTQNAAEAQFALRQYATHGQILWLAEFAALRAA